MPPFRKNWGDFIAEAKELEAEIPNPADYPRHVKQYLDLLFGVTQMVARIGADVAIKTSQDIKVALHEFINNADRINHVSGRVEKALLEVFPGKQKLIRDVFDLNAEFINYLKSFADAAMNLDGGRRKRSKRHSKKSKKAST